MKNLRHLFIYIMFMLVLSSCNSQQQDINGNKDLIKLSTINNEAKNERYIVVFKKNKDPLLIKKNGGKVLKETRNLPVAISRMPESVKRALEKNPNIVRIEKDKRVELISEATDWGVGATKSNIAWDVPYNGAGVKIAVLDTGIDVKHEDLKLSGGISFITEENGDASYNDFNGHGTHVAGIISAQHNGIGVKGVAPNALIYSVKVLDKNGAGYLSNVIAGIDWSITNKIDVLNLSLGMSTYSATLKSIIDKANNSGMVIVAAAGNSGNFEGTGDNVDYPAKFENAIAVAAVTNRNLRAEFSSTGPAVELAAPGESVLSTYANNQYNYSSGTSMATPYVTGIAALMKEAHPQWSNSDLRSHLQRTAVDLGVAGIDSQYGYGLVQFKKVTTEQNSAPTAIERPVLKSTDSTHDSITIEWYPVNEATEYILKRNNEILYRGKEMKFTDIDVQPGSRYRYDIFALKDELVSKPLEIDTGTKVRTPLLQYTKLDSQTIQFEWNGLVEAVEYKLTRNGQIIYKGPTPGFVDRDLAYSTAYEYALYALGETGESEPSKVTITTQEFIPKNRLNLKGQAFEGRVDLQWSTTENEGYFIYINGKRYNSQPIVQNSTSITNLTNGKVYSFTVSSINQDGIESEHSNLLELKPRVDVNFNDIPELHWARPEIQTIGERGWMMGTSPNIFSPNQGLARAEAAVIIVRALQLKPIEGKRLSFRDVNQNHWASREVEIIAQHEIMTGKSKDTFSPADAVTREQMAVILFRLFLKDKPLQKEVDYKDVEPTHWAYEEIMATTYHNIFKGFDNQTFKPKNTLTRGQMAVLMYRISPYFY
jgi:minor extracellular protease Epr